MTLYVDDGDFRLHLGDVRQVLPTLGANSVDCALTSPPFFGLRDYGVDGQIGLESHPDAWAAELVSVFREVRRVLKPSGTLWVECGDSYVSGQGGRQSAVGELPPTTRFDRKEAGEKREGLPSSFGERDVGPRFYPGRDTNLKPKDLLGTPWLLAFALRADGWWLRQAIIWHKPNAMPESATDRCTTAHSYIFLFSKSPRYWFDADAIAEPAEWARWGDQTTPKYEGTDTASGWMQPKTKAELQKAAHSSGNGANDRKRAFTAATVHLEAAYPAMKNARSVWSIPTQGYPDAHFATWPEALVERILKAGCPEWVCGACGKARERILSERPYPKELANAKKAHGGIGNNLGGQKHQDWLNANPREFVGWSDCGCGAGFTPGVCLDPFMGSGTTALVARRLGRRSIGVELNESYAAMCAKRLQQLSLLAEEHAS